MEKRYQVFVSSTYTDLVDERKEVIQALMELDCIPAGMELFPAADEEQFSFIKKVIDDCDYYVLIIGGRYGSVTTEGISYTEKEFDYACERHIPVLAFIHKNPGGIAVSKSETEPALRTKLTGFKTKAMTSRVVKEWEHPKELSGLVSRSIAKAIKMYPAVGWVRGDQAASADILADLNAVRKKNEELEKKLGSTSPQIADLAGLDCKVVINGTESYLPVGEGQSWRLTTTWEKLFAAFGPHLLAGTIDGILKDRFDAEAKELLPGTHLDYFRANDQDYQQVKIQFIALGLVSQKGHSWQLTEKGHNTLIHLRAQRAPASSRQKK